MISQERIYQLAFEVAIEQLEVARKKLVTAEAERDSYRQTVDTVVTLRRERNDFQKIATELLSASVVQNGRLDSCNAQIKSLRKALRAERAECDRVVTALCAAEANGSKLRDQVASLGVEVNVQRDRRIRAEFAEAAQLEMMHNAKKSGRWR
jgi:hypothetical protein